MTDLPYATSPCASILRVQSGPAIERQVVVTCGHPGCKASFVKPMKGKPYPAEAVARFARHAGWTGKAKKGVFYCPDHRRH